MASAPSDTFQLCWWRAENGGGGGCAVHSCDASLLPASASTAADWIVGQWGEAAYYEHVAGAEHWRHACRPLDGGSRPCHSCTVPLGRAGGAAAGEGGLYAPVVLLCCCALAILWAGPLTLLLEAVSANKKRLCEFIDYYRQAPGKRTQQAAHGHSRAAAMEGGGRGRADAGGRPRGIWSRLGSYKWGYTF